MNCIKWLFLLQVQEPAYKKHVTRIEFYQFACSSLPVSQRHPVPLRETQRDETSWSFSKSWLKINYGFAQQRQQISLSSRFKLWSCKSPRVLWSERKSTRINKAYRLCRCCCSELSSTLIVDHLSCRHLFIWFPYWGNNSQWNGLFITPWNALICFKYPHTRWHNKWDIEQRNCCQLSL